MSGVAIVRALLVAHAPLTAHVPTTRIQAGVLPQGTTLPAVSITDISGVDRNIVNPLTTVRVTDRIQVTVMASNYVQQKDLLKLVRKACRDKRGVIAGFKGTVVLTDVKGPDLLGTDTGIFMQSQDFRVFYEETP